MRCSSVLPFIQILIPILLLKMIEAKDEGDLEHSIEKREAANTQPADFDAAHFDYGGNTGIDKRQSDDYGDSGNVRTDHSGKKVNDQIAVAEFGKRLPRSSPPPSPESGEFFGHRTRKRSNDRGREEDPAEWGEGRGMNKPKSKPKFKREIPVEFHHPEIPLRRFARRIFDWSDEERLTRADYGIKDDGDSDYHLLAVPVRTNDELPSGENINRFHFQSDSGESQQKLELREWRYNELGYPVAAD